MRTDESARGGQSGRAASVDNVLLPMHPVYAILDGSVLGVRGIGLAAAAEALLDGGIRLLQIRWKENWTEPVYREAARVAEMCTAHDAGLVVNDRADVAMLLPRAGVHVGQGDLSPSAVRAIVGPERAIGYSTHNEAQFRAAFTEPVDYIAVGPIYGTSSKVNPDPVVGPAELRRFRSLTDKPIVAIGGITLGRAPEVWRAGADSIAIIGDLYPPGCTPASIRHRAGQWTEAAYEHSNR